MLADYNRPEDIVGDSGLLKQLTTALLERALAAEPTDHPGYEKHDPAGYKSGNSRRRKGRKAPTGDFGEIEIEPHPPEEALFLRHCGAVRD